MTREELIFTLKAAIAGGERETADTLVKRHHLADIAAVLSELEDRAVRLFLGLVPANHCGELLGYLEPEHQTRLIAGMERTEMIRLFRAMDADDQADLLQRLPTGAREHVLPALAQAERDALLRLAAYDEGTVGAEMTSEYVILHPDRSAREAIEEIRRQAPDKETIYQAYVVDAERRLIGTVSLRELIVAPGEARVENLMKREVVYARAEAPRKVASELIARYDLIAVPVINGGDRLVGIVTYDDAMDVDVEETTDLFHKAGGGLGHLGASLREASVQLLYRKRVFWLVLLVFGNIFSGAGIAAFEDTIAAHIALVFFLPLLIDSGGNAGSQAATLMVRALATGEARMADWRRMLGKEVAVAALLGLTMAVAVSLLGLVRGGPEIALVVALSMVIIVIVGSTIGMSIPFALSRLKRGPATASAPLITSIADASGVLIYFAIATLVLPDLAAA